MYKARPFFESTSREEYKEFLSQPFQIGMIGLVDFNQLNTEPIFQEWRGKQMSSWTEFVHDDGATVEFYGSKVPYKIRNLKLKTQREFLFPFPKNINEFICDCTRCLIDLHWSDYAIQTGDIKNLVSPEEFMEYMNNILERLGKI